MFFHVLAHFRVVLVGVFCDRPLETTSTSVGKTGTSVQQLYDRKCVTSSSRRRLVSPRLVFEVVTASAAATRIAQLINFLNKVNWNGKLVQKLKLVAPRKAYAFGHEVWQTP